MEDPRIAPLLANVDKHDVMGQSDGAGAELLGADGAREKVTPAMVDALAARGSMPLCMTQIHGALKSEHKIKHLSLIHI